MDILKNPIVGKGLALAKRYSPEILTAIGIAGMVTTVVVASKATLKLEPIVEDIRDAKSDVDGAADEEILQTGTYDKSKYNQALAKVYVRGALDISKLYGPSFALGVSSIGCILAAHGIMQKRAVALVAAYKTLESSFIEYRKRVSSELGEDREKDIYLGRYEEELEDAKGRKKKVIAADPNILSAYARFFDDGSPNWSKTPEYNLLFLKAQQNYANDMLTSRGHVFLNEIYDMLGLPRSQAGSVVGWVISKDGDNFIDFGMYDIHNKAAADFINGHEASILLDFNVDGVIYDRI